MNELNRASESANHCQRNWSEQKVSIETINKLATVATKMPTKQNEEYYTLVASTDTEYNHFVYMHSYVPDNTVLAKPFDERHTSNFNTQLRAPLLFQWFSNTSKKFLHGHYPQDGLLSIGISAGAVALAANQLGLRTGFCVCLHKEPVIDVINKRHNTTFNDIVISLGIGYPLEHLDHNVGIRPSGETFSKSTYEKTVKYIIQ